MMKEKLPEVWQRGPVENIQPLLQPVAHALLQAKEEVEVIMHSFPDELLGEKLAGMASPGFHLQHLAGVLDRLFTYARGEKLTEAQLTYLTMEGRVPQIPYTVADLVTAFNGSIIQALTQLERTDESELTQVRSVGRKQVPSTVIGLLFHAAEHSMRHVGQLMVTVNTLKAGFK